MMNDERRMNLGRMTMYGVGGDADFFAEVHNLAELQDFLLEAREKGLEVRVLGAGSNVLVSDLGVRGAVVRLGDEFRKISFEDDGYGVVVAGAAVPIGRLLSLSAEQSLGGLEFMAGIPGQLGGAVRMNAGAYGDEIGERVLWIRGLKFDGVECRFSGSDLIWEYRGCAALRNIVVTEVGLRLDATERESVLAQIDDIKRKRMWQKGLRCAGSVFRNPPGMRAGELLDRCGLKGVRIGGARVFEGHANFVVADDSAVASDVVALIRLMAARVKDELGVELRGELEVW
jgi:UDP-N-acetylmuramate dehydrogenase